MAAGYFLNSDIGQFQTVVVNPSPSDLNEGLTPVRFNMGYVFNTLTLSENFRGVAIKNGNVTIAIISKYNGDTAYIVAASGSVWLYYRVL